MTRQPQSGEIRTPETRPPRRRPGRVRRFVLRPLLWSLVPVALALLALGAYLKSESFRERARGFLVARLSDGLGRPVGVGAIDFTLMPLSLELTELVIPGPTPEARPVARVPFLRLEASILGWRRPEVHLERLEVRAPELYVEVDAEGRTNLPTPPPGSGGEQRFELRLGTLLLEQGAFTLNERTVPLELVGRAIEARVVGRPGRELGLDGELRVGALDLTLPGGKSYPLAVEADVRFAGGRLTVPRLAATGEGVTLRAEAEVRPNERPLAIDVGFDARARLELLTALGYTRGEVVGPLHGEGRLEVRGTDWRLTGTALSPELAAPPWFSGNLLVEVVGGPRALVFTLPDGELAGGRASGTVTVDLVRDGTPIEIALEAREVDAAAILANVGLPPLKLGGRASGPVRYAFLPAAPFAGEGRAELVLVPDPARPEDLALGGPLVLTTANGRLSSARAVLEGAGQRVELVGLTVALESGQGGLALRVDSTDLGPLLPLLPLALEPAPPAWLPTAGRGVLAGSLRFGGESAIVAEVDLDLESLVASGYRADQASGRLRLTERALEELDLTLARGAGTARVVGRVSFEELPPERAAEELGLEIEAQAWPLAEIAGLLPLQLPVVGPVSGRVSLSGGAEALSGRVDAQVVGATVAGLPAERLTVRLAFDPAEVRVDAAELRWPAGTVSAAGSIGLATGAPLALTVAAPALALAAEPLAGWLGPALGGSVAARGTIGGSLERPAASLVLDWGQVRLLGEPTAPAELVARWDGAALDVEGSVAGLVEVDGGGSLSAERAQLSFDVASPHLERLGALSGERLPDGLTGSARGVLTIAGELAAPRVALDLDPVEVVFRDYRLQNLEPVRLTLDGEEIRVLSVYLGDAARQAELFVGGRVGLGAEGAALLRLQASLPAVWLEPWAGGVKLGGTINALGSFTSQGDQAGFNGQADLAEAEIILPGFPHSLAGVRAVALFYPDQVVLDSFDSRFAGGTVRGAGSVRLPSLDYRFQAAAEGFKLRYPEGWAVEGDAELSLTPTPTGRLINGSVRLARAAYLEDVSFSLFELLGDFLRRRRVTLAARDADLAATQLNVVVVGNDAVSIKNNLANVRADADLVVRGSLDRPLLVGRVEARQGSTLIYDETEYRVERGLLTFASLDRIDPVVDLVAVADIRDYEVRLALSGTLERLSASFSSDPPLPDLDVLALLSGGGDLERTEAGAPPAGGSSAGTAGAAQDFLTGQLTKAVTGRVKSLFGFDKLKIDPISTSAGSLSAARLVVGKQISRDLSVTYQRDVSSDAEELLEAQWRVAPGLEVIFSVKDGRQYGVDLRWERRY